MSLHSAHSLFPSSISTNLKAKVASGEPGFSTNCKNPLLALPTELLHKIFDLLDPIDSTCLGLSACHLYQIFRHIYGRVALNCRRIGPNDLEWVWRRFSHIFPELDFPRAQYFHSSLNQELSATQRPQCRHCGTQRCELHRHIRKWVNSDGKSPEYCSVMEKFGPLASKTASEYCYYCNPKYRSQCGRHYDRWIKSRK